LEGATAPLQGPAPTSCPWAFNPTAPLAEADAKVRKNTTNTQTLQRKHLIKKVIH